MRDLPQHGQGDRPDKRFRGSESAMFIPSKGLSFLFLASGHLGFIFC